MDINNILKLIFIPMKGVLISTVLASSIVCHSQGIRHPNVIIIITDDQGYGDLELHR